MLNLKSAQIEKLKACRRAAADLFATLSSEKEVEEARRLLARETSLCAEEACAALRQDPPQR